MTTHKRQKAKSCGSQLVEHGGTTVNQQTTESFARGVYNVVSKAPQGYRDVPKFEGATKEHYVKLVNAYFNFDGNLPYNGWSSIKWSLGELADGALERDKILFTLMDAALQELTRVWMELSGVVDISHPVH
jgi:hypothetical protein